MIESILSTLLAAWILSLFGFQSIVKIGMLELFGLVISTSSYYFILVLIGCVSRFSILRYVLNYKNDHK